MAEGLAANTLEQVAQNRVACKLLCHDQPESGSADIALFEDTQVMQVKMCAAQDPATGKNGREISRRMQAFSAGEAERNCDQTARR